MEGRFPVLGGLARLGCFTALCGLASLQHLSAATTVMVTNDWASAKVQVASPTIATAPPGSAWSEEHLGEAVADLRLSQTGIDPTSIINFQFTGNASAQIGPSLDLAGVSTPPGATVLFGAHLLADDTQGCQAEATLDSIWKLTIMGDSIPFYARGFAEFGHSMGFTLKDVTTGQEVFSTPFSKSASINGTGMLEQSHEYLLTLNQSTFSGGDGSTDFEFGFVAPVQIEFSNNRTHLPIPEPSALSLVCIGAALLVRRRR